MRVLAVLASQVEVLEAKALESKDEFSPALIKEVLAILKVLYDHTILQEVEELRELKAAEKLSDAELEQALRKALRKSTADEAE